MAEIKYAGLDALEALKNNVLPLTGGTLSGNLEVAITELDNSYVQVGNSHHVGKMIADANGEFGIESTTHSKWLVYCDTKGDVYLNGNANSANYANALSSARTISLTGSVTGSGSFDGSGNLSIATTTNHTHNYAGSSSAGGAATSANKVNTNLIIKLNGGSTEGTNLFTFNGSTAKTINITPSAIGAATASESTLSWSWTNASSNTTTVTMRKAGTSPNQALDIVSTVGSTTTYNVLVSNDGSRNWVYKTGDTLTGNLAIYHSDSTESALVIQNSLHKGDIAVSNAGNFGVYDVTYGKWLVKSDSSGNVSYAAGTFTGDVVLGNYALRTSVITKYGDATAGLKIVTGTSWKALSAINDGTTALGYSNVRFTTVYANNSTINTSDEMEKDIISGITEPYENWYLSLNPILYKWKNTGNEIKPHDRIHCGLGARESLKLAEEQGLDSVSLAVICIDELEEESVFGQTERYGMGYEELHGMHINMIQKAFKCIEDLKTENQELKERITKLESVA